ncbi:MAG TPA: glycosyltransferase [Candidatus Saccharimonadales bacterium]|nr:glycosyltransferase [Candidatus Saccharimonadales bacterium]
MTERRILYVNNGADIYGASRCLIRLVKALDRTRYIPLVLLPEDGPLRQKLEALGVEVVFHPRLSIITRRVIRSWRILIFFIEFPASVLFLWRLIRRRKIDLVHTNTGVMVSPGLAAKLAGIPHLWHIRDWFQEFRRIWKPYSSYILWSSDAVIAISQSVASQFADDSKISVVYDGCSLDEFHSDDAQAGQDFRRRFGLGTDFVAGCVGRIKLFQKGQEVLVQAAAVLKARGLRPKILIVGTPYPGNESHLQSLKDLIHKSGLQDSVILTGELDDVKPAYAAMNVLVLPSVAQEGLGDVMMEAMAMRVPVIATNIGGPLEVVQDGISGFLVPPSDPEALADKIELLMNDPKLAERLGQAGPKRVMQRFSIGEMIRKIEALYGKWMRQPAN